MEKAFLSKSTFIRGLQCLKSLYLHKKRPFLRDKLSAAQLNKFDRGHEVGFLAQKIFPGGEDCSPASPSAYRKSVEKTQSLIENKFPVIYEATLQAEGVLIMADILVWNGRAYDMYEVKSSLKLSQTHLYDVALQYYIMQQAHLTPEATYLIYVNADYLYEGGEIDPLRFFRTVNVTADVMDLQEKVKATIEAEKQVLTAESSPDIPIGPWCYSPYSCDFIGHCWKNEPLDSVARLESASPEIRFQWKNQGIRTWVELKNQGLKNPLLNAEIQALSSGKPFIDKHRLADQLELIHNASIAFVLAAENAIPRIPMTHPFDPVPLAWGFTGPQGRIVNAGTIEGEASPFDLFKHDFINVKMQGETSVITWGSRAVKVWQHLFPEFMVVDLSEWLWSDFLYFPWSKSNADPLSFAHKAGLCQKTTEGNAPEAILRKISKDHLDSEQLLLDYISAQLNAMHQVVTLLQKIAHS